MKGLLYKWVKYVTISSGIILFAVSCTKPPPPSLRSVDRQLIDSLYSLHYDSVKTLLDSNCAILRAEILEQATDSILKRRLVDMAKLKNKYQHKMLRPTKPKREK